MASRYSGGTGIFSRYRMPGGGDTTPRRDTPAPTTPAPVPAPAEFDSAYDLMLQMLRDFGLESLAAAVLKFLQDGYTQEQVSMLIQDTPEYKERFRGNEKRKTAGIPALSPRDYLSVEEAYRQILASNGMPIGFYDQHSDFVDWIGNDVAPTEIAGRVGVAVELANNLSNDQAAFIYDQYGLRRDDLAAYFLDQDRALPQLRKIEKAMRIGGAARMDQLDMTAGRAEYLAGFAGERDINQLVATVAEATKRGRQLSAIYGGEDYGQGEAEEEVFAASETARRKRLALAAQEEAAFSGTSGVGKTTLSKSKSY